MVFYFTSNSTFVAKMSPMLTFTAPPAVDPPAVIYMGRDKEESATLRFVWFL